MRDRPFISANEPPRPYGDVLAERRQMDPAYQRKKATLAEIGRLEAEAADQQDPAERKRIQCEAEGLRCLLADNS